MTKILLFALAGTAAQLVDGALGMAFGVTATSILLLTGIGPAAASAAVHFAEVGTTLASGTSHWRLKNIHWPTVAALGIPGAIGAFLGATVLAKLSTKAAEPVVTTILLSLGFFVLLRSWFKPWGAAARKQATTPRRTPRTRLGLGALGLSGGFLDATGGGGWGPLTTSTLLSLGKAEPRKVIGTVSASEFLVSVAASVGFLFGMGNEFFALWQPVLGLLVGGVIAAPIAAWAVTKINPRILGAMVGVLLVALNTSRLVAFSETHPVRVLLGCAGIGLTLLAFFVWSNRRAAAKQRALPTEEDVTEADGVMNASQNRSEPNSGGLVAPVTNRENCPSPANEQHSEVSEGAASRVR